jgi:hypothetical protein
MRAIDFGTSSTAAAQRIDGGAPELVTFQGDYSFSSCVAVHHGDLLCGSEAEALLPADPAAGTRVPKLILAQRGTAYLDGATVPVEEIIAPILREADSGDVPAAPGPRILTHPAGWEPEGAHCAVLLDAAHRAGLDDVELVSEPEAVAWYFGDRVGTREAFAVFDLGGGTCDMAALQRENGGFDLLARPHSETIGGELANSLLMDLVLDRLDEHRGDSADALRGAQRIQAGAHAAALDPETLVWLQRLIGVQAQVRVAKERLSTHERVLVRFPAPLRDVKIEITRSELADRMRPHLDRAADALTAVLDEAGLAPERTSVLVSGAASMMPCVAQTLRERCGVTPTPVRPPKGAVALGALAALEARHAPPTRRPGGSTWVQANVTRIVQDSGWDDLSEPERAWLLDAVLNAPQDDDFEELIADVAMLTDEPSETVGDATWNTIRTRGGSLDSGALAVTSAGLLWAGTRPDGEAVGDQIRFADATDVRPATSSATGLHGMRIQLADGWRTLVFVDDGVQQILDRIGRIGALLPAGGPRDGGRTMATLRAFTAANGYEDLPRKSAASLLDALATAEVPEDIQWVESCNAGRTRLVTTSQRLLWTREDAESTVNEARHVAIGNIAGLSDANRGLYGFRVTIGKESHEFHAWHADENVKYILTRQGKTLANWVRNIGKLRDFADWDDVDLEAQNWLEHALYVANNEELLAFEYCSYEEDSIWSPPDLTRTTALLLTSQRVLWVRVGIFFGLSSGKATISQVTKVEPNSDGVWLTIRGVRHGFVGFRRQMASKLRRLRGS